MQVAHVVAQRSTCRRLNVGCVITNLEGTSIVSMGYNGNARGLPDGCDSAEPGACGCLHAEENALLKAPYGHALVLYTTATPCLMCAKRIINSSVSQVYFDEPYRKTDGLELLEKVGISIEQLDGLSWWMNQAHKANLEIQELTRAKQLAHVALKGFMYLSSPGWRPGLAATRSFDERSLQAVQDANVQVSSPDHHPVGQLVVEMR